MGKPIQTQAGWTNSTLKQKFTLRCSKCAFSFGMFVLSFSIGFYISSFWIAKQVQENKHCFLRLFLLVSFHGQYHWFCQQCQSQSSIHFFSHLALSFPLSLMPHIQSPDFANSHHLEIHGFRNYAYSLVSLQNFEHFCTTLNPNPKEFMNVVSNEQAVPNSERFKRTNTVLTR